MTKSHSTPPKMGNNGGTAFVRINGKRTYLGKFGSAEAAQNYARCVAEWAISNTDPGQATVPVGNITVDTLAIAFLDHFKKTTPRHYYGQRTAVRILLRLYSGVTVDAFTPKCLAAVQHQFTQYVEQIDSGGKRRSRQYCNTMTHYIKKMFRWGVAQELVPPSTADALKYVPPLRCGQTEAPETDPREDVPDEVVDATLPYLLRHAGVSELVAEHDGDREIARAVAGQKSIGVTQEYNHADLKIAIEQAKKRWHQPDDTPGGLPEK